MIEVFKHSGTMFLLFFKYEIRDAVLAVCIFLYNLDLHVDGSILQYDASMENARETINKMRC